MIVEKYRGYAGECFPVPQKKCETRFWLYGMLIAWIWKLESDCHTVRINANK